MMASAERYRATFQHDDLTARPTRRVAVLTCMDARLDVFRLLGLQIGDSHILRNAGGRATEDAIRSLVLSANALGTREIAVIHHTGCGLHGQTDDTIADRVEEVSGLRPSMAFHAFDDLVTSVTGDVALLSACPYLPPGTIVWGAYYDVGDGSLTTVGTPCVVRTVDDGDATALGSATSAA